MKLAFAATTLLAMVFGVALVRAQQVTTLIQFTNVWKFDQSGLEPGTAWRTNDYDDAAWVSGRGLLGFEDNVQLYAIHAPFNTQLTVSSAVTTFYFRATFNFAGTTNGLSLIATNLVDDGCVIYLNGLPAGGVRATPAYNATTTFPGPAAEGQLDVVTLTNLGALRSGANLLAVEVHQAANISADIVWGTKLMAIQATPLVITNPPQSQTVVVGDPVTFNVGVSGGPAAYQWQKDGVNIANATNATFSIANAQLANSGLYRVIATNSISAVTSGVATLTVFADTTGPKLVAAIGNNIPNGGGSPFGSNTINVLFNEVVNTSITGAGVRNTNNYLVTRLGGGNPLRVVNVLYVQTLGALLTVDATDPNWIPGGDYLLTVNNVQDLSGNVIAPNSQIAVSWLRTTNVTQASDPWRFHNSWIFDPEPITTNWYACDFVEGPWWATGSGCFYFGPSGSVLCGGDTGATPTGYQDQPMLFRRWFNWPVDLPTANVTLWPRFLVDDGAIFYLNGVEIARHNMPAGPVDFSSKALTIVGWPPSCVTNISWAVSNLITGSNCLAVGVFQAANPSDADVAFCFEFDARYRVTPSLVPETTPRLAATPLGPDRLRLSWTGHGYALESATNLSFGAASYPLGPWQQVTNMSNPYTNNLSDPARFFRLKK